MTDEQLFAEEKVCNGKCQDDIDKNYVHCKDCVKIKYFLAGLHEEQPQLTEKDKQIAELNLKLSALEGETPWKDIKDKSELIKRNVELEAQIEKMKCCENCAFFKEKTYDICHRIKKFGTRKCAFYKMN